VKDQTELRERLVELHGVCPGCGEPISVSDQLHHWMTVFRRLPDPWKWSAELCILVHAACHVPPAPHLDYESAKMKLQVFGSKGIESFVASAPTKIPIALSDAYYEARLSVESW
jgi:hypothetical protein